MRLPLEVPFNGLALDDFITTMKPTQIEMTDKQYSWFAGIVGKNATMIDNIPIVFLDGPKGDIIGGYGTRVS